MRRSSPWTRTARTAALIALVVAVPLVCAGTQARAAWPGQNGLIVFSGDTNSGNPADEIWAVQADGSNLHQILPGTASQDAIPYEVSPDGSKVVILRPGNPGLSVQTLDIQTGALTRIDLPDLFTADSDPAYSPDGSQISFVRLPEHQYYVANADGTGTPTRVGPSQPFPETGEGSTSPDGTQQLSIGPAADVPGGGDQLFVSDLATGATTRLTSFQPDPLHPHWSFQPVMHAIWQTVAPVSSTPPAVSHHVSPAAPDGAGGWYVTAPTVTFACAGAAPIASCLVDGGNSASTTLGENASPQTVTATGIDTLGNVGHDTAAGLLVDLSPPNVSCSQSSPSFTLGASATLSATVADAISGPSPASVSAPAATASAGSFYGSLTGQDKAGNHATIACPYTVVAPPTVSHQVSPAAPNGSAGWYVTAPTVTFTCSSTASIVSCLVDGGSTAARTLGQSSASQTVNATGIDSLGAAGHDTATGLLVDLSPPTLTCNQSNPTFSVGDQATLSATVGDAISGPSTPTVSAAAATAAAGSFSVSLTGQDRAGNRATIACPYTVNAAHAGPTVLVGDPALETHTDSNSAGVAEAFHFTATASGTLDHLSVYLDKTSKASRVVVGIYSGTASHPTALLVQAVVAAPTTVAWNVAATTQASLFSGQDYWIAILAPAGTGTVAFRDRCCGGGGGGSTETSKSSSLTALPATWSTGARYSDGPLSAYGSTVG